MLLEETVWVAVCPGRTSPRLKERLSDCNLVSNEKRSGTRIFLRRENGWLQSGIPVESTSDLFNVLGRVRGSSAFRGGLERHH
jgi:hypothetical protein